MPSTANRKRGNCAKYGRVQSGKNKGKCRTRKASTGKRKATASKRKASTGKRKCAKGVVKGGKRKGKCRKRKASTAGKKKKKSSSRRGNCVKWGRSERTGKCRKGPVTHGSGADYLPTDGLPASWTAGMFEANPAGWGTFSGKYAGRDICKHGRRKTKTGAWGGCRTAAEAKKARAAYTKRTGKEEAWYQGSCANPPPCLPTQVGYKLATGEVCCRNKKNQADSYATYVAAQTAMKKDGAGAAPAMSDSQKAAVERMRADSAKTGISSGKTAEQLRAEAAARGGAATV
jgi:hypothetical protein